MNKPVTIVLPLDGKDINVTVDEARKIYEELHSIFGQKQPVLPTIWPLPTTTPYPDPWWTQPIISTPRTGDVPWAPQPSTFGITIKSVDGGCETVVS